MKQLDLPFKIDKQFEKWEFDLEFFKSHIASNSYQYQIFYYLKSEKNIKVFLVFNCDFLAGIFYIYTNIKLPANGKFNNSFEVIKISEKTIVLKTKKNWEITFEELKQIFSIL